MVGLTPLLWVLALVAAVLRLWARRRVLAALSVAVLALDRAWALTRLGLPRAGTPAAATAPQPRLFSANVHYGNPKIGSIAGGDPDGGSRRLRNVAGSFSMRRCC